jgi:hypothetical protein
MALKERIIVAIDFVTTGATKGLNDIKSATAGVDGSFNKMKAGGSAAFASLGLNATRVAVAGGAALTAFAAKSVMAFQSTALEAGKLRDSLGLTAEQASRLMEVAGDLDIPVKNLENSLGKMNVVAARTPEFFADIGAGIAKAADGSTDVQQTFMNVVDGLNAIPDAAERASAAQRIFGKDWRTISELIRRGSGELKRNLEEVGNAKIMSDEEIADARALRDRMDELKDKFEEISLTLGGKLVPALTDTADVVIEVADAAEKLQLSRIFQAAWWTTPIGAIGAFKSNLTDLVRLVTLGGLESDKGAGKMRGLGDAAASAAKQAENSSGSWGAAEHAVEEAGEEVTRFADQTTTAMEMVDRSIRLAADVTMTAMDDIAESIADGGEEFAKSQEWWTTYEENVNTAVEGARSSFTEFTDEALTDLGRFRDELSFQAGSMQTWQDNLLMIAGTASGDFASYLAEMGAAGQGLVAELAANPKELKATFDAWITLTQVSMRDMGDEFRQAEVYGGQAIDELDGTVQKKLKDSAVKSKSGGNQVGTAIGQGIAQGIGSQSSAVAAAAANAVNTALQAAKAAGKIESPSKLFADEVGTPIVEGIEEGIVEDADKIGDALEKAIETAEKDALKAVDDLVDAARDRFSDAWGDIADQRSIDDLQQRVWDAGTELAQVNADPESTPEARAKALKAWEDANYALLKSSQALLGQGPAGVAAFTDLAQSAGLTATEIGRLVESYNALTAAQAAAVTQTAAIKTEVDQAQAIRSEFGQLAAAGFFNEDQLKHLAQFNGDPSTQLAVMRQLVIDANNLIGQLPKFHGGGVVPGAAGSEVPIMAQAGEMVIPNGSRGQPTIVVNAQGAVGLSGPQVEQWVAEALTRWQRRNGQR